MELKKVTTIIATDSAGNELVKGDSYCLQVGEKELSGVFNGFTAHGGLEFIGTMTKAKYSVMPKSIKEIVKI